MMNLNMLVGSGGVLSHAPRRNQSALMMMDGFRPEGFTELAVDSIFMMPQLGVLSTVNEQAALQVFSKDCLVRLGWCIAPRGRGKDGAPCMTVELSTNGQSPRHEVAFGQIQLIPLESGEKATVRAVPAKGFDVGAGKGQVVEREISGGVVGLILDGRGRPFALPKERAARVRKLTEWNKALHIYPEA